MASTASGSRHMSQPTASSSERQPQAGPLPAKVGEIGYTEYFQEVDLADGNSTDAGHSTEGLNAAEVDAQLGRHPADRSYGDLPATANQTRPLPPRTASRAASTTHTATASSSTINLAKPPKAQSYLSRNKFYGITYKSILRLAIFCVLIAGDIGGWIIGALKSNHLTGTQSNQNLMSISPIFLHLIFAVILLILLVFFERAIFRVRAERYAHVHPGQILPSARNRFQAGHVTARSEAIAFAPWNRPPLPTYAAALGFRGTGDVEDAIIAAPPPPAYGNTRGSTLLLANLVRNSIRSMRESWQVVDMAEVDRRASARSARSLPVPYEESEHHEDARRAQRLADTLAQLEEGGSSDRRNRS